MRLRPYINETDYQYLEKWIDSERLHALWCANLIPYPLSKEGLEETLTGDAVKWEANAFVATENTGTPVGFFSYSVNHSENSGFLRYIVLDKEKRGVGLGRQMLVLALKYAFEITDVSLVSLNVFDVNEKARKCYAKVGFSEKSITENSFSFGNEKWGRCHLEIGADDLPCQ